MNLNGLSLPATVFERYMLLDDRPSHPMHSFLEVDLQGDLPLTRLETTLTDALARHPLMSSTIRRRTATHFDWQFTLTPPDIQHLTAETSLPVLHSLDLEQAPGVRIWVRPRPGGLMVILLVHHAVCDALGMLTFLMEWLALAAGCETRLPECTCDALLSREDFRGIPAAFSRRQRWRNISRYLLGKPPVPLALPEPDEPISMASLQADESAYHSLSLTTAETDLLRQVARRFGASLNDCLAAALFLTLRDWERLYRPESSSRPFRILIPVNRRPPHQPFFSACNHIGYKMLTRHIEQLQPPVLLLDSIREEMDPVRRHPRGVHSFLKMLHRFGRLGLLNRTVQRYDCFATVILSNLGDLDRYFAPLFDSLPASVSTRTRDSDPPAMAIHRSSGLGRHEPLDGEPGLPSLGGVRIRQIRCAPPRRPNTHLTIVALTLAGRLQLVASRISPGLNSSRTLEFLQRFRDTILQVSEELRGSISGGLNGETTPFDSARSTAPLREPERNSQ